MISFRNVVWIICLLLVAPPASVTSASNRCSSGQVSVQSLTNPPTSNGCSKPAGISVGGEEDFTYCCDRHDVCYSTCGASKDFCESDFGKCMQELCKSQFSHNPQCGGAASMYQMGTTMFGGDGFDNLQVDHCQCIDESEVSNHYAKVLRQIYENHANKSGQEISEQLSKLREKVISQNWTVQKQVRWYANIFYRTLKKYDTAIEHAEQRVGMNPPRIGDEL